MLKLRYRFSASDCTTYGIPITLKGLLALYMGILCVHNSNASLEEVIVTAQKRSANLQETAAAIEVYSGESLLQRGILSVDEISRISPSVYIERSGPTAYAYIRGIGNSSIGNGTDGSVALYQDGVYVSRPSALLLDNYDIDSIEVLKGPQGSLYGRNATGGALLVKTAQAELGEVGGHLKASVGNFDRRRVEAAFNLPLSDKMAVRVAGMFNDDSGFADNLFTGRDLEDRRTEAVRVQLSYESNGWMVKLGGEYSELSGTRGGALKTDVTQFAPVLALFGGTVPTNPYRHFFDFEPNSVVENKSGYFVFSKEISGVEVTSTTAYREIFSSRSYDLDGTEIAFAATEFGDLTSEAFTQDLQVQNAGSERLSWILGASYIKDELGGDIFAAVYPIGVTVANGSENEAEAYALFGEFNYDLSDSLSMVFGLRYSNEEKSQLFNTKLPNPVYDRETFEAWNPSIGLTYQADNEQLYYIKVSTGFKSGGFNANLVQPPFEEEEILSYELGAKTTWLDNRLVLNAAVFYYDYTDLQVSQVVLPNPVPVIQNAGAADVYGFEIDMFASPVENLDISLSLTVLDTSYGDLVIPNGEKLGTPLESIDGNQFARAPEYAVSGNIAYLVPVSYGDLRFQLGASYKSKIYFSQFENDVLAQDGYTLLDGGVSWILDDIEVSLYGRNLTDEVYTVNRGASPSFTGTQYIYGEPKHYGVSFNWRY